MYAGSTIELCALEKFVHLAGLPPPPLVLVAIDTPDGDGSTVQHTLQDLPPGWSDLPTSASAQQHGKAWLDQASQLLLLVPSTIVPEALNAVINPAHPAYKKIKLQIVREFTFDSRMWKA